jgi:hypothetical protein
LGAEVSEHKTPIPAAPTPAAPDIERLKIAVDIWKYVVSVQMHFNDIGMKIRTLYFTLLAAAVGAIGFVQGKHVEIPYLDLRLSLAMIVLVAIMAVSALFYFLDRHWYHRLLQGSVKAAADIEKQYAIELPEIQLGAKISAASPVKFAHPIWRWMFFFVTEDNFRKHHRLHSDAKIEVLYKSVIYGSGAIAVLFALVRGIEIHQHPLLYWEGVGFNAIIHQLFS